MHFIYGLFLLSILTACGSRTTSPHESYGHVQREVLCRTGEMVDPGTPCWDIAPYLNEEMRIENVLAVALANNPLLQAEYQRLGISQADLVQAGLFENPVFDMSFIYHSKIGPQSIIDLALIQNILDIFLAPIRVKAAKADLKRIEKEVAGSVLDLIAEAKSRFIALQAAKKNLRVQRDFHGIADAAYTMAKKMREAGNITELELSTKQGALVEAEYSLESAKLAVMERREMLNVAMGLWGCEGEWDVSDTFLPVSDTPFCIDGLVESAFQNSLDLKAIQYSYRQTAIINGVQVAETIFPEIGLGPASEKEADGTWFAGPLASIPIPIFDWGLAATARTKAQLRQLRHLYVAKAVEIRAATRTAAYQALTARHQFMTVDQTLMPVAAQTSEETLRQVNAMQIGVFHLLEAKRNEVAAVERLAEAYRNFWTAQIRLDTLIAGRNWVNQ